MMRVRYLISVVLTMVCTLSYGQDAIDKAKMIEQSKIQDSVLNKDIADLKLNYKGKIIAGPILTTVGLGGIGWGIYLKNHPGFQSEDFVDNGGNIREDALKTAIKQYRLRYIGLISTSCAITSVGIIMTALGVHNKKIYLDKAKAITLNLYGNSVGMAFNL